MIADLKPYAKYKESGLPWLGQVPGHWETRPAFGAFMPNRERNFCMKEKTVLSLSYGRIVIKPPEKLHGLVPESFETYQIVNPGDIVIRTTDLQNDHTSLRIGMVRNRGIITSAYLALKLKAGVIPEFGFQFLNVWDTSKAIYEYGSGLRQNLDFSHFKRMPVPVPPPDEQAAIVRFLDWATGKLERAIRAKRKVIALLNEQKQAIIHRAVTRGLGSSVPLKPSSIPWLGDIPQHWDVRQLRHMGRLHKGVGGSKEDATPEGVPCVRYGELYFHYRHFILQPRGFVSADKAATYTPIRFGDVLFAASGERVEEIGKSAVNLYGEAAVCGGDIVIFRPTVAVHAAFLGYALDSYGAAHQKATMCRGTTIKHIYPDELRSLWTCLPPVSEQEKIAATLDSELLGCNTAVSRLEREIELLREYRTRLVADVVTGKLDVREAAARLPDEAPLESTEDDTEPGDEPEADNDEATI
ncbi:MAG: restriction endonuclease subunit S [Deltaproteobacteria bacterium]|nr:restriction endonuclease subunit S [Deltaproteobacteria bacterium]